MKIKLIVLLAALAVLQRAHGAEVSVAVDIHLGHMPPPPPPEVIVIEHAPPPGPPPWAPAHGFRRNRDYYYYPGADVYYRPEDRVWFYLDGRDWRFGASLPTSIRVDFDRCVPVRMETDRPFQFHNEMRVHYPPDYFVTKVKIKDKPGRSDDDSPGKGKGKGKGKAKDK